MKSLKILSPAKINLYLKITGRRSDGYHNLVTLFHRISLADTLRLRRRPSGFSLKCSNPDLPLNEDNLITKAYRLLQERFPKIGGVSVYLKKQIPVGAGLGGGSSNAAFFLLGMKKLYGLKISRPELLTIGSQLGADVPFFLWDVPQAIGTEKGDRLQPKPSKTRLKFALVVDNKGLATREVYQNLPKNLPPASLTKITREITMLCAFLAQHQVEKAGSLLQNDLELSAFKLRPSLRRIIEIFKKRGIPFARLTGSGPTVFGIVSDIRDVKRRVEELRKDLLSSRILLCHSF